MSGQHLYNIVAKVGQSAETWNHVYRQQKCGSFAECWKFHGLKGFLMKSYVIARQIRFVRHVLRKESLENLVLTDKCEGHRARGRQRLTFRRWLERAFGIQLLDMIVTLEQRRK